jgi:hypothetical protein
MDAYKQLLAQARQKRDNAIQAARDEYRQSVKEIKQVCRTVGLRRPSGARQPSQRKLRRSNGKPFCGLSIVEAAERVLLEGRPLTLIELAVAMRERGYSIGDDPRKFTNALRAAMRYHPGRFVRGKDGRWAVART